MDENKSSSTQRCILNFIEEGKFFIKNSEYEKAIELLEKALALCEKIKNSHLRAEVHNYMGKSRFYIGDYEKAMEHYVTALSLFEIETDIKGLGNVLLNIGSVYAHQNNPTKALEYFNKSLEKCRSINDIQGISYATNNAATIYSRLDEKEKAKKMFEEAAQTAESLIDRAHLSKCLTNLGQVELDLKNYEKALSFYKKALQIEEQLNCTRTLCYVLFNIAEAYFHIESYENMHYYLNETLEKSKEVSDKHVELYCYILYYTYYEKIADYKEALTYYKLYSKQKELIFNENRDKTIAELQVKYDIYRKEKEKEIYKLKNSELLELNKKLQAAYLELENLYKIDYLTKLYNRQAITEIMEKEIFNETNKNPFILCIADIDDFKKINDAYGHEAGDEALRHCSKLLTETLRETDYLARWGGEEFLIILPNTNLETGKNVIEVLRNIIYESSLKFENYSIQYTMSFGLGCFNCDNEIRDCIKGADKCLYECKRNGKNCICTLEQIDFLNFKK